MNTINDHKEGFGEKKRTAKPKGAKDKVTRKRIKTKSKEKPRYSTEI
jgi:hypothetical protein